VPNNPSIELLHETRLVFLLHLQAVKKLVSSSKLSQWRMPSAPNRQLLSFSTSTEWYDPPPPRCRNHFFVGMRTRKVMAGSAARVAPLIRLKYFLRAALRCESARLKPHLVLILCWCGAMGIRPKVGERQADGREGRQRGKDQRGERVPRHGATSKLEASPRQKSSADGVATERKGERPIRIWQCVRNKEVRRFRASSNG
jgi:hypothetical protein